MEEQKYRLTIAEIGSNEFYLEMNDLTEAAIQIWDSPDGEKKAFVRIKISDSNLENIISEYNRIQALQKTNK
tara:strand:+ start:200 stop:415 length:216 start_codon:yes stop_codon:yes gene_type:complete